MEKVSLFRLCQLIPREQSAGYSKLLSVSGSRLQYLEEVTIYVAMYTFASFVIPVYSIILLVIIKFCYLLPSHIPSKQEKSAADSLMIWDISGS